MNANALLVYGDLGDGRYERHVALERPGNISLTQLPGVMLDVAPRFAG